MWKKKRKKERNDKVTHGIKIKDAKMKVTSPDVAAFRIILVKFVILIPMAAED